ncbi:MAG: terminase small subunit [Alistipes indistinctus]
MAKASLTIKQEKFCNKYLECGNASEAYRYAYDCSKMSDNSVWCNASQLLADTKVAQRLEYLKSHLAEASGITALQIIREHQKSPSPMQPAFVMDGCRLKSSKALPMTKGMYSVRRNKTDQAYHSDGRRGD